MGRDRDDISIGDILSQLTKDEAVLEEVRKAAIRGLTARGTSERSGVSSDGGNVTAVAAVDRASSSSSDERSHGKNNNDSLSDLQKRRSPVSPATVEGPQEDLAFNISKDSATYQSIYSTVQWYRDSFLIGSKYADQRSVERQAEREKSNNNDDKMKITQTVQEEQEQYKQHYDKTSIPLSDPNTAMAHPLLLSAGENYLRSIYAVDLLKPYATWGVSKDGPMFATATRSLAQTIPLGQESCDWAMRENLLWVLQDEEWKDFAKSITTTYVDRSYSGR